MLLSNARGDAVSTRGNLFLGWTDAEADAWAFGFGGDARVVFAATAAEASVGRKLRREPNHQTNYNEPYYPPNERGTLRHVDGLEVFRGAVKWEELIAA